MNKHLFSAVFFAGVAAIAWVGIGFIDSSLLAMMMTVLIGLVYGIGALELRQFRQSSAALAAALAAIPDKLGELGDWLVHVPATLQNPVRLRIEGERVALPGPALTPYLVGLLVMLGMLGTFLGMVLTLNGAVFALEKTTDLQAIRSALSLPVKGLGLAFGTSIAGVAASAMLGLMSALSRRERAQVAQVLDTRIATVLRRFSLSYQRQETFKALQQQSQALPAVVERLQAMMAHMESMGQQLNQRLLGNQEAFHDNIRGVYTELATAVDKSLRESLGRSAQVAGASLKPVVEAAMTEIARDARQMHERLAVTVQMQLDGVAARFGETTDKVSATLATALDSQQQANASVIAGVGNAMTAFNDSFEQRAAGLVAQVGEAYARLQAAQADNDRERQQAWAQSLEAMAATLGRQWQEAGAQTLARQQQASDALSQSLGAITSRAEASANRTLDETSRLIGSAEALLRARIEAEAGWLEQHRVRMDELAGLLRTELGALRSDEAARGDAAVERLAALQAALAAHLTTLGTALEAPLSRLIETASEAPRAAAEVIVQLRQEISANVARDNDMLEERSRIMASLHALLEAINRAAQEQRAAIESLVSASAATLESASSAFADNVQHAAREQRAAIESLVSASATTLESASTAFAGNVATEAAKLGDIAAHVTSSAVDVASLSEAFSFAVQSFSEANDKLIANLQRIEGAMDKSAARSDEQLAYYVAQAREIIDLSMMSQKDIIEELRQLPARQASVAEEAR